MIHRRSSLGLYLVLLDLFHSWNVRLFDIIDSMNQTNCGSSRKSSPVAESNSEVLRNRLLGLFLVGFGSWNLISGELLPFPTRQHVEGLPARIIGGIILAIGLLVLARTITIGRSESEDEEGS